jgi:uncharacterized OB-fold protein
VTDTNFKTPTVTKLGRPFWEAARQGRLVLQRCSDCGKFVFYPSSLCEHCLSESLEWTEVSGQGTVESYSTVYRAFNPEFAEDVPYTVALVRLDEGVLLLSWLTDVEPDAAEIGMRVTVTFEKMNDEISLHRFRPAPSA